MQPPFDLGIRLYFTRKRTTAAAEQVAVQVVHCGTGTAPKTKRLENGESFGQKFIVPEKTRIAGRSNAGLKFLRIKPPPKRDERSCEGCRGRLKSCFCRTSSEV